MGLSMAGLASTMQGYQQGTRQAQIDEQVARNAQRDQWKFEQEQKAADEAKRIADYENGTSANSATAKVKQNAEGQAQSPGLGSTIMQKVGGLFSGSQPSGAQAQAPADSGVRAPVADRSFLPDQSPATLESAQAGLGRAMKVSERLNFSREKYMKDNPNDTKGLEYWNKRVADAKAAEDASDHAAYQKKGEGALKRFIASGGIDTGALDEFVTQHFPDGQARKTERTTDGKYIITRQSDGAKSLPMTMDEYGQAFVNIMQPSTYQTAMAKAQEAGAKSNAELPAKKEEATHKGEVDKGVNTSKANDEAVNYSLRTLEDVKKSKETGQTAQNFSSAGNSSAEAEGKRLANKNARALSDVNAELAKVDEAAEPSRYKELMKKKASLEPRITNQGGLHTTIGEDGNGNKVPIITDPVTGNVYQGGNVIYQRGQTTPPAPAPAAKPKQFAVAPPAGFNPL